MVTFLGLMAPKGTPADVVTLLNREINAILADPAERKALEDQGMIPAGGALPTSRPRSRRTRLARQDHQGAQLRIQ